MLCQWIWRRYDEQTNKYIEGKEHATELTEASQTCTVKSRYGQDKIGDFCSTFSLRF